jgi:molybdopterin synthase sulfur carrier subunit
MDIQVRFFASVRETLGTSNESIHLPPNVLTIGELRNYLCARGEPWSNTLAMPSNVRVAYNQTMADDMTSLSQDCEVAFFPPVTGG